MQKLRLNSTRIIAKDLRILKCVDSSQLGRRKYFSIKRRHLTPEFNLIRHGHLVNFATLSAAFRFEPFMGTFPKNFGFGPEKKLKAGWRNLLILGSLLSP